MFSRKQLVAIVIVTAILLIGAILYLGQYQQIIKNETTDNQMTERTEKMTNIDKELKKTIRAETERRLTNSLGEETLAELAALSPEELSERTFALRGEFSNLVKGYAGLEPNSDEEKAHGKRTDIVHNLLEAAMLRLEEEIDGAEVELENSAVIWNDEDGRQYVFTYQSRSISYPEVLNHDFTWIGYVRGLNQRFNLGSCEDYIGGVWYNCHDHGDELDHFETVRIAEYGGKAYLVWRTYCYDESVVVGSPRDPDEDIMVKRATVVDYDDARMVDRLSGENVYEIHEGERFLHRDENYRPTIVDEILTGKSDYDFSVIPDEVLARMMLDVGK